jgi:hypothetical protein
MMDDLRTRALLVGFDRAGAVGTTVPRAEIAEAASGTEFPATLLLDIDKVADGGDVASQARVAVDWDQETLEQLLSSTEDPEIELWFDERELAMAFDDVEAHGLRQRAAVLTIAVAAAGATAAPAFARTAADTSGAGGPATSAFNASAQAGVRAVPVGGAERALVQDEKLSQGLDAGTGQVAATDRSTSSQAGAPAVPIGGAERALVQDEKVSQGMSTGTAQSEATSSSSDTTLSSGELAAVVAGGVLLISAAGFGVSRKRTPPAQPA